MKRLPSQLYMREEITEEFKNKFVSTLSSQFLHYAIEESYQSIGKKTYKSSQKEKFHLQSIGMLDVGLQNLKRFLVGLALSHIKEKHLNTDNSSNS